MVRSFYRLGLCVSLATLAAACGGGKNNSTGSGGSAGNGGTGGTGATTSSGGSGGMTGGAAGSGGMTGGSAGGMTGGAAGSGGMTGGAAGSGGMTGGAAGSGGMAGSGGVGGMAGNGGAGGMTTSTVTGPSDQIAAVRAAADGGGLSLPVSGAFVTYTKPVLGQDVAGFFVQAEAAGPAIFVAVDPATLNPAPAVGDEIELTVNSVATQDGLKEITGLTGLNILSSNNPIAPLVTDVSASADLVSNLAMYESRAIHLTGSFSAAFTSAGAPQVATKITTAGLDDPNLKLRMPDTIRAQYDLKAGCMATVDYGVMWRFNATAQPSVYQPMSLTGMSCPAPTVIGATPISATQVVVTFDRKLDPATVDAADFTFDNGLTAMNAMVNANGVDVTVTTSQDAPGITYTVTVANLNDVLGAPIGMPNSTMFTSYVPVAQMILNELSPNITGGHDLIELLVTGDGSTNGITILQKGSATDTLITMPDLSVVAGDFIVVHLVPSGVAGIAPAAETMSKNQYPNAMYGANYDGAWDLLGGTTGLTFSMRVLEVVAPGGLIIDAVPVVLSNSASPPAAFPGTLQTIQAANLWLPPDCGGMLCTYNSTPTAVAISVDYLGAGSTPAGKSISRKLGMNTKQNTDWNAAGAQTIGGANP